MKRRILLKVDPRIVDPEEESFERECYRSLSTAQRFRMSIDRSILLQKLARQTETDRESSRLSKRR